MHYRLAYYSNEKHKLQTLIDNRLSYRVQPATAHAMKRQKYTEIFNKYYYYFYYYLIKYKGYSDMPVHPEKL